MHSLLRARFAAVAFGLAMAGSTAAAEAPPPKLVTFKATCGDNQFLAEKATGKFPATIVQSLRIQKFTTSGQWPVSAATASTHTCKITDVTALYHANDKTVDATLTGQTCTVSKPAIYKNVPQPITSANQMIVVAEAKLKTETGIVLTVRKRYMIGTPKGSYTLVGGFSKTPAYVKQTTAIAVACE